MNLTNIIQMTETASSVPKPMKAVTQLNKLKNVPKQQSNNVQTDMNFFNPVAAGHI